MATLAYVSFALSVLALALVSVSLSLVFAWRKTSPETAALRREVRQLEFAQVDIADKLILWMKRDDARVARAEKKDKRRDDEDLDQPSLPFPQPPVQNLETKEQLRQRVMGVTAK